MQEKPQVSFTDFRPGARNSRKYRQVMRQTFLLWPRLASVAFPVCTLWGQIGGPLHLCHVIKQQNTT